MEGPDCFVQACHRDVLRADTMVRDDEIDDGRHELNCELARSHCT
jgi:hypothetical protein